MIKSVTLILATFSFIHVYFSLLFVLFHLSQRSPGGAETACAHRNDPGHLAAAETPGEGGPRCPPLCVSHLQDVRAEGRPVHHWSLYQLRDGHLPKHRQHARPALDQTVLRRAMPDRQLSTEKIPSIMFVTNERGLMLKIENQEE